MSSTPDAFLSHRAAEWEEITIVASLHRLGFRGWRVKRTGVEFILPPTCEVAASLCLVGNTISDKEPAGNERTPARVFVGTFDGRERLSRKRGKRVLRGNPHCGAALLAVAQVYSQASKSGHAAYRFPYWPDSYSYHMGFRLVRSEEA